jgi:excisionase family DNA binding protein
MSAGVTVTLAGAALQLQGAAIEILADQVAAVLEQRGVSEPEPWLTVEEAAAYRRCSVRQIYRLVAERKGNPDAGLEHRKEGRRVLFRREWLDEDLERP